MNWNGRLITARSGSNCTVTREPKPCAGLLILRNRELEVLVRKRLCVGAAAEHGPRGCAQFLIATRIVELVGKTEFLPYLNL